MMTIRCELSIKEKVYNKINRSKESRGMVLFSAEDEQYKRILFVCCHGTKDGLLVHGESGFKSSVLLDKVMNADRWKENYEGNIDYVFTISCHGDKQETYESNGVVIAPLFINEGTISAGADSLFSGGYVYTMFAPDDSINPLFEEAISLVNS